jgi:hypothetical protein
LVEGSDLSVRRTLCELLVNRSTRIARYRQIEDWTGTSVLREPAARYEVYSNMEIAAPRQNFGSDPARN